MIRATRLLVLLLLAGRAAAQNPPAKTSAPAGQDSPGLVSKQLPNLNGGVVTYYSGNRLKDDESQTATNVFFDKDSGVVKRQGQTLYQTIPGCAAAVRAQAEYDSPGEISYFLAACGGNVYVSNNGSTFAVLGGTINATAPVYFTQGMGFEWVVDGIDSLWSTNGVTVSSYPFPGIITSTGQAPIANLDAVFQNRLVLANVLGGASAVYLAGLNSGAVGSPLDFTLPAVIVDTSAAIFGLNGLNDGLNVTCMSSAFRNVLILWDHNYMYGLYGSGNSTFVLRELSEIGCDEQSTVQEYEGKLRWLSQYGLYQYDGLNTVRISDNIKDQILNIIGTEPGYLFITQQLQSDWQGGNLTASGPGAPLSATISPNNVLSSSATFSDTGFGGTFSGGISSAAIVGVSQQPGFTLKSSTNILPLAAFNKNTTDSNGDSFVEVNWNGGYPFANAGYNCASFKVGSPCLLLGASPSNTSENTYAGFYVYSSTGGLIFVSSTTEGTGNAYGYGINYCGANNASPNGQTNTFSFQNVSASSAVYFTFLTRQDSQGYFAKASMSLTVPIGYSASFQCSTLGVPGSDNDSTGVQLLIISSVTVSSYSVSGVYVSTVFNTAFSTPTYSEFVLPEISSGPTGNVALGYQSSVDGLNWSAAQTMTAGNVPSPAEQYWRYVTTFTAPSGTSTPTMDGTISLQAGTTGYFITSCFPTSPNVGWGVFQANSNSGNGAITYAVSTGTTCNAAVATNAAWTPQTDFTTIGVATAPFLGVRVLFSGTTYYAPTNTPTLQSITINWQSAAGRPNTASEVFDNRYWLAYTTSTTGTAYNNSVLIYDNDGHWSGPFVGVNAASLGVYQRQLYAGSSLANGQVILENSGNTDLGNSILFDFKSPSYELDAFNTVDLYDLNLEFTSVPAGYSPSVQVQYYVDSSTVPYSLGTVPLQVGSKGVIFTNARFPLNGAPVKAHNITFEVLDNTPTPLTLYRAMIRYTPEDGP